MCPSAVFRHYSIFADTAPVRASITQLAEAIAAAAESGAKLINCSLNIDTGVLGGDRVLIEALDLAYSKGAIVITAAGNQERMTFGPLVAHMATVPTVALGVRGVPLRGTNLSPSIGRRGLSIVAERIRGYGLTGTTTFMSGSSVAAALLTGGLARVWQGNSWLHGRDILAIIQNMARKSSLVPPTFDEVILERHIRLRHSQPRLKLKSSH
jgi:hypothetical protein